MSVKSYEKLLGRSLTSEEKSNYKTYGVISAQEFEVDDIELKPGQCICGAFECKDEYAHWSSGW